MINWILNRFADDEPRSDEDLDLFEFALVIFISAAVFLGGVIFKAVV